MDPELHVFFSKHMVSHNSKTRVKILRQAQQGSEFTISFEHMPVPTLINGQYAVLRFYLFASFFPESEEHTIQPYKRKRPFYNGFIHVSVLKPGESYLVMMRDSSLAIIDGRLKRDPSDIMTIQVKCIKFETSSNVKLVGHYSEEEREKQRKTMQSLTNRYYDFIKRASPSLDSISAMHVPRMPCNMHDIILPGAMFVMDMLEDSPPENLLDIALEIQNMTRQEFTEISKRQFSSRDGRVSPQFYRVCFVAFRVVCLYSHMCEYTADIKVKGDGQLEEVERFISTFLTQAGDCEDLLCAIVIQYIAWTQQTVSDTNSPLYYLIKILRLFLPCAISGSAFSPSAKSRDSPASDDLICHIWGIAVPWYHFAKWVNIERESEYPWEQDLFPWILEGTNDSTPCLKPLFAICESSKKEQVRQEMRMMEEKRNQVEAAFPALRIFGLYGFFKNFDDPEPRTVSDFYHMANELWAPYDMLRLGFNATTFELYGDALEKGYGVSIRKIVYDPQHIIARPVFEYTSQELEICLETLKQQHPIHIVPDYVTKPELEHAQEIQEYEFMALSNLQRDFPASDAHDVIDKSSGYFPPYLRYFVKVIEFCWFFFFYLFFFFLSGCQSHYLWCVLGSEDCPVSAIFGFLWIQLSSLSSGRSKICGNSSIL